jgi:hypothetical protein
MLSPPPWSVSLASSTLLKAGLLRARLRLPVQVAPVVMLPPVAFQQSPR